MGEGTGGQGGQGGGGSAPDVRGAGSPGTTNTGGGGGGATGSDSGDPFAGGSGGSGIVIVRYPIPAEEGTITSTVIEFDWVIDVNTWREVQVNATTASDNSITVQVLNAAQSPIDGKTVTIEDGDTDASIDLSDLDPEAYPTIYLKATLTDSGGGTPFLEDWTVTWAVELSTAIYIVGKTDDDAVSKITFPVAAPGATVNNPYNDVDKDTDPQVLGDPDSSPVVRLKNTSEGGTLKVWLEITDWTNGVVASQRYELVEIAITNIEAVTKTLSADGSADIVDTEVTIASDAHKALYLEVTLGDAAGKTGTSMLTILGEPV